VEEYLLAVFGTADPFFPTDTSAAGRTARELLDRGTARLDTALANEPQVRSRLRTALGRVYANLGLYDQAGRQLELALSEQRNVSGDRNAVGAAILDELGLLRDRQGRIAEADSLLEMALDRYRRISGSPDSATAATLEHLSEVRREQNDFESAETLIREALSIRRALHGDSALATSMSQQMLAEVLANRGDNEAAAPLYQAALEIRERQVGRNHPLGGEVDVHACAHRAATRPHRGGGESLPAGSRRPTADAGGGPSFGRSDPERACGHAAQGGFALE
jgi:tetratricopeptide (TPR) repeat protein